MPKEKRGFNLKKGTSAGDYGRQRAHEIQGMKDLRKRTGSGTTKHRKRAVYGSRKGVKRYKPRGK